MADLLSLTLWKVSEIEATERRTVILIKLNFSGVCAQTRTILQQAYNESLKPILFLNKIDRLIIERNMSTADAEKHLRRVLEQVNAVVGNIFASNILSAEDTSNDNQESALESADDSTLYFSPSAGNVIFGSAQDGW